MKHLKSFVCTFLLSASIASPHALGQTLSCSHREVCKLAASIAGEYNRTDLKFETLVTMSGDPHEFEPAAQELKALINAPLLLAGPHELNPWIKKVNKQRSRTPQNKTITLELAKNHIEFYQAGHHHSSKEALSHFWLYPKIYCSLKAELEQKMLAEKILSGVPSKSRCQSEAEKAENDLRLSLMNLQLPLILTHDALLPLINKLKPASLAIVAIKGSGHHEETSATAVKKLYDILKYPKAIWIIEPGIHVPSNVLARKRAADISLKIDTANTSGNGAFATIAQLSSELEKNKK